MWGKGSTAGGRANLKNTSADEGGQEETNFITGGGTGIRSEDRGGGAEGSQKQQKNAQCPGDPFRKESVAQGLIGLRNWVQRQKNVGTTRVGSATWRES